MNVEQIRNAILEIKNNPVKAAQMSENALEHSKNFDITKRAERIMNFIQSKIVDIS